jgi:hypothetical protein
MRATTDEKGHRMRVDFYAALTRHDGRAMLEGKIAREWIDACLDKKPPELADVAEKLRALVKRVVKDTKESVNPWKIPTFESNGPMCFFMVGKNHVTFGFLRGTSLPDPTGLLEGTGKNLRHVKVKSVDDLKKPALKKLILAAAKLNKKEPMAGMKPRKNKK